MSRQPALRAADRRRMRAVMRAIREHRSFLVCSHVNPEGDALGSALALASLLKRLKKKVVLGNDGGVPEAFRFFPQVAPVVSRPRARIQVEAAVTVDVPLLSRTGVFAPLIEKTPVRVNIDHHVSNQCFGTVNWVDPKAAAVGEMIYRLFRGFGLTPNKSEALCLYVSIVTDTGSFRYMSTTSQVHRIASELIAAGKISPLWVAQALYECHALGDLKFLGKVLRNVRSAEGGRIVWVEVPNRLLRAARPGPEMIDELVNYPRSVRTAEVAFTLREQVPGKEIRVSFRSKGRVDVNRIARTFGGGGHRAASGCTIAGPLVRARAAVLRAARLALKTG